MPSDLEYIPNYLTDTLYTHPGKEGAYAKLVAENETFIGEIEVTSRSRLAVSAFFVNNKGDYGTFKITKLKYHKSYGWQEDGHVEITHFDLAKMKAFVSILATVDLRDSTKTRISLGDIQIEALSTIFGSSHGAELMRELSASSELRDDIYAVATKDVHLSNSIQIYRRV